MKEFKYTITDPEGIHARPAGETGKGGKTVYEYDQTDERRKEWRLQKRFSVSWDWQ